MTPADLTRLFNKLDAIYYVLWVIVGLLVYLAMKL